MHLLDLEGVSSTICLKETIVVDLELSSAFFITRIIS